MSTQFYPAPEVASIAKELIEEKPRLEHLKRHQVPIRYIFRSDTPKRNGQEVWGTARLVTGHTAFLAQWIYRTQSFLEAKPEDLEKANSPFFLIPISLPVWERCKEKQQRALTYHELRHCWAEADDEGEVKLSIVGHEFEGFADELQEFGLWRPSAELIAAAVKPHIQAVLPFEPSNGSSNGASNGNGSTNGNGHISKRTTTLTLHKNGGGS